MSKITFTILTLLTLINLTLDPQQSPAQTLDNRDAQIEQPKTDTAPQGGTSRGTGSR